MKLIKKVSSVPLAQTEGHIIDSFNTSDDHTTNAPSLNAVETSAVMKPTILYNNASGSRDTLTLSDAIENYTYIELIYGKGHAQNEGGLTSSKIIVGVTNYASLIVFCPLSTTPQLLTREIYITGTSISNEKAYYINFTSNGVTTGASNEIRIYRVLGYK
jgi:hypothetical protein